MHYFITFACYGAHLHGAETGSVDRHHNLFGGRFAEPDPGLELSVRRHMLQPPYLLDQESRTVVLAAMREACSYRGWALLAAHVRANHVHVVVKAEEQPERVMNAFKSYASRALNRLGRDGPIRTRWARHGSTRWLWKRQDLQEAIHYVVHEQGEPMTLFVAGTSCAEASAPLWSRLRNAGRPLLHSRGSVTTAAQ